SRPPLKHRTLMTNLCNSNSKVIAIAIFPLTMFSCNLDSVSDLEMDQQLSVEQETQDEVTDANLRLVGLIFEELFGSGSAFSGQSLQFAGSHSFQIMSDPQKSSNKAATFELLYSDSIVKCGKRAVAGFRDKLR